jgi:hypothetical protein
VEREIFKFKNTSRSSFSETDITTNTLKHLVGCGSLSVARERVQVSKKLYLDNWNWPNKDANYFFLRFWVPLLSLIPFALLFLFIFDRWWDMFIYHNLVICWRRRCNLKKKKLGIRLNDLLIWGDKSHCPLTRVHVKLEFFCVWTSQAKLALGGIEHETLRIAHSKVPSQHH